jgi:type II secretory pathway pseudopilin PulG
MTKKHRQSGFSLTEVVFAIATLAIGMLFVGGTFMLGVHFSRVSTEQSIAPVVAEEAFAKIALQGIEALPSDETFDLLTLVDANDWDYRYPSVNDQTLKQYHWAAIGRTNGAGMADVTVFVMRQEASLQTVPQMSTNVLNDPSIMDGMTVIDGTTGDMLRASVERGSEAVVLWPALATDPTSVWYIEPSDGRNPCVGVYQRKIRF